MGIVEFQFAILAFGFVAFVLIKYLDRTTIPKIKNLPEIPGVPLFGNLIQLGNEHPRKNREWSKTYGSVFQIRLGNRRVVIANTYDAIRHFWVVHQSSLISRPRLHTYHNVVSSSQGFTIGTSPWDESCKRRRKAATSALNRPAVQSYMPIIDLELNASIKELLQDSKGGSVDIDPCPYFQRFALNTSLILNYGFRISGNIDDDLLKEICLVEREISDLRSTSNNWQDYIPLMRFWPNRNTKAKMWRERRDAYLDLLIGKLKERIAMGTDKPCITGNILKDPEAKLNYTELKSICLTMVSGGLDTTPGHLIMGVGYLASPHGQAIQERAYSEILKVYPDGDAWERCLVEEKVPYITAFVKEILRFWSIVPMGLPRVNINDIPWQGAVIPAGTTFMMNAYAANHDETHYKDPATFNPDRYLDVSEATGSLHYAFGAGTRMCGGWQLANRELYTAFLRLISAFHFVEAENLADRPILDPLECNANKTGLTVDPKPFKIGIRVRDRERLEEFIRASSERTKDI